jgi:phosphoribosylaminoimidazole-succinocarboxamide synthase
MGSVKDLIVLDKPAASKTGRGRFVFSDRYSVFDWGEMPNHIANKGKALCLLGAFFFEKLEKHGIKTHYQGIVVEENVRRLDEADRATNVMEVKLIRVLRPEEKEMVYDYSIYKRERSNFLIPLEVIYRNSLPAGSSVFKRLKEGSLKPEDIGLERVPEPGEKLAAPILDVSTKLEEIDRYMSWEEAERMANLDPEEIENIKATTLLIDQLITQETEKLGLYHEDGKVEFGFDENRELILVDVLGTPDECRFTSDDIPVSKEAARIFYRKTSWFEEVEAAKKKDRVNWKTLVTTPPPPLNKQLDMLFSQLYQAFCNEVTHRDWFEVPPLRSILQELKTELRL